jgi:Mg-chelatase subunit ChlD
MRIRHRTPSIFNISMVDVLCCALGCVILLWLLNLREAKQRSLQAGESQQQLTLTQSERDQLLADQRTDRTRLSDLESRLRQKEDDLMGSQRRAADLADQLARAEMRVQELKALADDLPGLREDLMAKDAVIQVLEKDLADRKSELAGSGKELESLAAMRRKLEEDLATRGKELTDASKTYRDQLARAEEKLRTLDQELKDRKQELTTAQQTIATLQDDKRTLTATVGRMRAAVDNRFEGIALTGRRVIFLVDMSGSMKLVAEHTDAPEKWAGVREAVGRIMKSLPDLEKFQVIVFSNKATFLLGEEGRWIDFDPATSVDRVTKALADVEPKGGTDMFAALQAAFRYRANGLDAVYLMSDGLPNLGEGATAEEIKKLGDLELGAKLGKHILKTLKTDWNRADKGPRVHINAVGFFYESPDVGAFLWSLARDNDGSFVGMSRP